MRSGSLQKAVIPIPTDDSDLICPLLDDLYHICEHQVSVGEIPHFLFSDSHDGQ